MHEVIHYCGGNVIGCRCEELSRAYEAAKEEVVNFWRRMLEDFENEDLEQKDVWVLIDMIDGSRFLRLSSETHARDWADYGKSDIYFFADLT